MMQARFPAFQRGMAKLSPLQEQLLKAGLAKKAKLAQVARGQNKDWHAKGPADASEGQLQAERAREQKAEKDRALAAERKAQARAAEMGAQARQIIRDKRLPRSGESEYRFSADAAVRTILVNDDLRKKLASGALVIARLGDRYELLPRAAGEKVRERDASLIVLDHGQAADTAPEPGNAEDDAYYARFQVPDDLVW